ncbi:pentapeptide repeat-containing protein [Shewanella putrefaciens]|uniref:pentapeptide repeat-containing protein n=1 Tax=Shewanella putrefaciens TaxID=24 RepID=UPI002856DA1B|nr:pentapeptide repeat-containing protein [Shewanella putrefaciens]MDR6964198.1 uncharacterized protein YjbI with pentapeptide repeats [Shewanella putrefaciens]
MAFKIGQRAAPQGSHFLSEQFSGLSENVQEWQEVEFEDCEFLDCHFSESTFRKCKFIECRFVRCNLSLVKVPQCQFNAVVFEECKLVGIDWTRAAWPRLSFAAPFSFKQCILNDSSFLGLSLDEIVIEECKAHDVDFREGSFNRANFTYTDLSHSLFGRTQLADADFSEATNYDIDIFNNKIKGAKFSCDEAIRLLNCLDIELVD